MLLDEPTNHLDIAAVHQLMANLKRLDPQPASLLISHDLDLVKEAQQVYLLQNGRLVPSENCLEPVRQQSAQAAPGVSHDVPE